MSMIYRWYANLVEAKAASRITTTAPEAELKRLLATASRKLERECGGGLGIRTFIPYIATKKFDWQDRWLLTLRDDLLDVTQLTNGDGAIWTSADYFLYPANILPYREIQPNRAKNPFAYNDTPQQAIEIAAKWGFCDQHRDSGETIQDSGGIDDVVTAMKVETGADTYAVGMTLLVEDEQMFLSAIAGVNLTIVRGQNGTTAAAHDEDTPISIYYPPEDLMLACRILVSRWYQEEAAGWSQATGIPGAGFLVTRAIPDTVLEMLQPFIRYIGSAW